MLKIAREVALQLILGKIFTLALEMFCPCAYAIHIAVLLTAICYIIRSVLQFEALVFD